MIVVSFHPYKGGSCRTSTCINTIPYLSKKLQASEKEPILVIDTDIDSQGMTYFFNAQDDFGNYDTKDLLIGRLPGRNKKDCSPSEHELFSKYCMPIGRKLGVDDKAVFFLGINDKKEFAAQDMVGRVDNALMSLYLLCKEIGVKAIVFDTAAGDQFAARATIKASNVMVCCMRPTKQFRIGTKRFLNRLKDNIIDDTLQQTTVILLPTAVPTHDISIKGTDQRSHSLEVINDNFQSIPYISKAFLTEEQFGIPEIERFKWQETCLNRIKDDLDGEDDAIDALARYEHLAEEIINEGQPHNEQTV